MNRSGRNGATGRAVGPLSLHAGRGRAVAIAAASARDDSASEAAVRAE